MTNHDLQALRKALFLDVSEAAEHIGKCTPRTWQRWEDGTYSVPEDVENEIWMWAGIRAAKINDKREQKYYRTFDEYVAAGCRPVVVAWRICQSVYAHQLSTYDPSSVVDDDEPGDDVAYSD